MTKPPLWDLVNKLYHGLMDIMPQSLQERSMASAFTLGAAGSYCLVRSLQWLSKKVDKVVPGFDGIALPALEKICVAGMSLAPLIYSAVDPEGAMSVLKEHPTYISGMAGVYVGSIGGALQDLHVRSHRNPLTGFRYTKTGL